MIIKHVAERSKQFWGNIWSQSEDHKKDAKWLKDLRSEVNVKKQEKIDITTGNLKKILGRMPNWNYHYLLREFKIRGYRKRILSLWLQKGVFWVSEQRLVDRPNTTCRNS